MWTDYEKLGHGHVSSNDCLLLGNVIIIMSLPYFRTIQDPASQRLTWYKAPMTVLVIKKVRDAGVIQPFIQLVQWLIAEKNMVVYVESAVLDDPLLTGNPAFVFIKVNALPFRLGEQLLILRLVIAGQADDFFRRQRRLD